MRCGEVAISRFAGTGAAASPRVPAGHPSMTASTMADAATRRVSSEPTVMKEEPGHRPARARPDFDAAESGAWHDNTKHSLRRNIQRLAQDHADYTGMCHHQHVLAGVPFTDLLPGRLDARAEFSQWLGPP